MPREDVVADAAELVADRDESVRRAAALAAALRRPKPVDAQLIALTTQGELPMRDAAAALGLTAGAARVRLHRAHARLRLLLGPDPAPTTAEGAAR